MDKDALAVRLRATFLDEIDEQVRTLNADLLALESTPRDSERLRSVFRVVHTLKGAARAAGFPLVETVCHELESGLVEFREGRGELAASDFTTLFLAADALSDAGRRFRVNEDLAGSPLAKLAEQLARPSYDMRANRKLPAVRATSTAPPTSPPSSVAPSDVRARAVPVAPPPPTAPPAPSARPSNPAMVAVGGQSTADRMVRVTPERLDDLLAATGELTVLGSSVASRPADAEALRHLAATWTTEWRRTRATLRRALERAQMPEATNALGWLDEHLRRLSHDTDRLLNHLSADAQALSQITGDISDQVRRIRLRPFAEACEALPRAVRDVALHARKEVALEIEGADVEADRAVLDILRDALLHLIRNAIDHGIESPEERERAGKARRGSVRVKAALRGDRLVITVSDDGRGVDVAALQERLRERGLGPDATTPVDVVTLLLQGGLSSRTEASAISGRGVGLNAVRAAVERVRGTFDMDWSAGHGTIFTLTCPPSLATVRALLVGVGPRTFALPCADVERVMRVRPDDIKQAGGRDVVVDSLGRTVALAALDSLLGQQAQTQRSASDHLIVVVLVSNGRRVGVLVDRAIEDRDLVLRPIRTGRKPLPLVAGAAPLATGHLVLLLETGALVAAGLERGGDVAATHLGGAVAEPTRRRLLVVDDSLTTRALEQSVLEAAGYDVGTAVDGVQAWHLLQEQRYDLVVADVEMPRMDGFTLCETIRASRRYGKLPVVLVTALDAPEHRARGLQVGADAYLSKASFDQQQLLNMIQQLLG